MYSDDFIATYSTACGFLSVTGIRHLILCLFCEFSVCVTDFLKISTGFKF